MNFFCWHRCCVIESVGGRLGRIRDAFFVLKHYFFKHLFVWYENKNICFCRELSSPFCSVRINCNLLLHGDYLSYISLLRFCYFSGLADVVRGVQTGRESHSFDTSYNMSCCLLPFSCCVSPPSGMYPSSFLYRRKYVHCPSHMCLLLLACLSPWCRWNWISSW